MKWLLIAVLVASMSQHTPDQLVPESELYNLERSKPTVKKKIPKKTPTYTMTPDRFGPAGPSSDCRECRPYQKFTQEYQNCYKTYCKR